MKSAFGPGGKSGTLHAQIGSTPVHLTAIREAGCRCIGQQSVQRRTGGIGEAHMGNTAAEERLGALMCAIDELIRYDHVTGADVLEGSHR